MIEALRGARGRGRPHDAAGHQCAGSVRAVLREQGHLRNLDSWIEQPRPLRRPLPQPIAVMPPIARTGTSKPTPFITTWSGDWKCGCGSNNKLWDNCVCGQPSPCR